MKDKKPELEVYVWLDPVNKIVESLSEKEFEARVEKKEREKEAFFNPIEYLN